MAEVFERYRSSELTNLESAGLSWELLALGDANLVSYFYEPYPSVVGCNGSVGSNCGDCGSTWGGEEHNESGALKVCGWGKRWHEKPGAA
jgi:hypothetical protein